ncbi:V-type proton ATPase subunit D-like isoform X2 [Varroa jacobsoni]|uniref:V-type proton ATPase subunit D n=1 Tax=Varroa destructor TaxID=109461 RepID=A0A7M7K1J9_VARDE|nr:V-type proton ATPase subunit D-like isoform X2 [Varroa destructor]XP_022704551.1 V-type proton ATPase subunit D-like isoform X2 [Varroa jacobsoni]
MSKDRYNVFASRENYNNLVNRLRAIKRGHDLLEQKAESLTIRLREYEKIYRTKKTEMISVFTTAMMAIAEAKYVNSHFTQSVINGYVDRAFVTVKSHQSQVAGVHVVDFQVYRKEFEHDPFALIGLSRGGQKLKAVRQCFAKLIDLCVTVTSVQKIEKDLAQALQSTNRRMKALETFIIPRFENTIRHIQEELDELDRESFARIKLIQKKKMHHFTKEDTDRYSTGYSCPKSRREDDDCTTSSLTGSGSSCVIPRCIRALGYLSTS